MKTLEHLTLEELWNLFPITLLDYNKKYISYYEEQEHNLKEILLNLNIARISHIGSTSIIGIKGKPIIDILLEINDIKQIELISKILINDNWLLMCKTESPFKYSFNKGYTINGYEEKVYHLHIKKYKDCDELYFRDYLNNNKDILIEYQNLKIELLEKNKLNRDKYTEDKTEFVKRICDIAKKEYKNKY